MPQIVPSSLRIVPVAFACLVLSSHALVLDQEKASYATLSSTPITLSNRAELHLTGSGDPIPGCTVDLTSEDSWLFFQNVSPASVVSNLLSRIRVNGAAAVADANVRIVQYGASGAVVIPHPSGFQPLQVFTGTHFTGLSARLGTYKNYNHSLLGLHADNIRSFTLKRGYTATLAQNENGSGVSRNYVAQDADLEVALLPSGLDGNVSFIRVFPWRWTAKKGSCDVDPVALNASWYYNWNISSNSTRNWEYVGIRQTRWWPGLDQNWQTRGINHLSGYNEPDNPVEDAYTSLNNGSVDAAIAAWPDLLATGLRVGAPAVTDGGASWISSFIGKANAGGLRVDYVPVHYYRSYANKNDPAGAANQMYNFLKGIYDVAQRPIWVTEFNNGANWTDNNHDPDVNQNRDAVQAMIQMMDNTPWIERYAIYSRVEWFRQTHYDEGGLTPMGTMYRNHLSPIAHRQIVPNPAASGNTTYTFDNNLRDSVSGNNPLAYGTPKHVPGKFGKALSFDGTDDYLALPARLGDSTDFTFAAWVLWNGGANWQRVFDLGNGTPSYLFLTPKSGSNTLRVAARLNNGAEQQLNAPSLTPGVWTHLAVTLSGDTGKLFVNGSLVHANTSFTLNPVQIGTETNYLGKSQFADPLFNGLLDQVRFLDSALTDAQVASLAASAAPSFVESPSVGSAATGLAFTADLNTQLAAPAPNLTFTKISGPSWLTVAADGSLFGVPLLADAGVNEFLVSAAAPGGSTTNIVLPVPVLAPELVARYAFDGNSLAAAGTAHAATSGNPAFTAGRSGQAIDLDGVDDHASLPAGIASSDEITVSTWVQWDGGSNWQRLFDFGNGTDQYLFLSPKSGSNTLRFTIRNGGSEQYVETSALPIGSWTHLAATLGGTGGRLYLNGNLVASNPAMTLRPSSFKPVANYIGRSQFAADPFFNGRIDDFQIFHRALATVEIQNLRDASVPVVSAPSLTLPPATPETPYDQSVTAHVTSAAGIMDYSKVSGPSWLTVEPDGRVSGVPGISDSGTSIFRIRAQASHTLAADFELRIRVSPHPGLHAHYEFEGDALDATGSYPATTGGNPVFVNGLWGRALGFDGTDDFAQLHTLAARTLTDATFAARFRWDGGSSWQRIFDFGNSSSHYFFLSPSTPSGRMRFAITTGSYANEQFLDTTAAPVGEWTHVAVVLSGNQGTLYVNGAAVDTRTITLDPADIAPALHYLGRSQFPADPWFHGAIDDFRIYHRPLTPDEVKSLAIPPAPSVVPRPGYETWAGSHPFPSGQSAASADPDGDRLPNLIEWLLDSDPLDPQSGRAPVAERRHAGELGLAGENTYLAFSARLRKNRPGVTLVPEASARLATLGDPESAANVLQAGPPQDDGEFETITWYYKIPISSQPSGFMRLKVLQP